ncbi:outer membrane beta-barrel domain-containing protein [Bdellovibrionota bacterium FG-2]
MKSNGNYQGWGFQVVWVAIALLWLTLVAFSWAQAAQASDEYNFNWLDTDKQVYVLQNRRYSKSGHLLLSVMGGPGLSDPYRMTFHIDPRVAFYFTEEFGIEAFYVGVMNSENNTFKAFAQAAPNALSVVREIRGEMGGLIHWVPWYAKINVFNSILYFDWYFAGGAGTLSSRVEGTSAASGFVDQKLFSFFAATGHQYHLSQLWTVRLDIMGAYYSAPIYGTGQENAWFSNYRFGLGLGLRL